MGGARGLREGGEEGKGGKGRDSPVGKDSSCSSFLHIHWHSVSLPAFSPPNPLTLFPAECREEQDGAEEILPLLWTM